MKMIRIIISLLFIILLAACSQPDLAVKRAERAANAKGDIVIGVAWPFSTSKKTLKNGVDLAANEINKSGGVLGRKIKLIEKDDHLSLAKGQIIDYEFANNLNMVAVIGHLNSYISIPASSVFQEAGLLMISPGSSGMELTHQGYNLVFRTIPNDRSQGEQLANYAASKHYHKIIIYYINNTYGKDLAYYFEKQADRLGIRIVDRRSYDKVSSNYRQDLEDWKSLYSFDAIFLAGSLPESSQIIKDIRNIGIKNDKGEDIPVFGGAGLDSKQLIKLGGKAVEGTVVTSFFAYDMPGKKVANFDKAFAARYGSMPDASAADGYDAVKLLAYAIKKAGSTVPEKIADVLHHTVDWEGVSGKYTFDKNGDVVSKPIVLKKVKHGVFSYEPHGMMNHPDKSAK